jgi:1,4-dihydroxy-2-naphthoate octaprenyltransferase
MCLIFGILFIILPTKFWERLARAIDEPVIVVERSIRRFNILGGLLFLIIGTWLIYLALVNENIWYFHLLGSILVIVALLYFFAPDWFITISTLSGKEIFKIDNVAIASRFSFGFILILISIYIFLKLFLVWDRLLF